MGANRAERAMVHLKNAPEGPAGYLKSVTEILTLDRVNTDHITGENLPMMNWGLGKLHSQAAVDGLIIFDSRVAGALTHYINTFVRHKNLAKIPAPLRFMVTAKRRPAPISPSGDNHPLFTRDYRWVRAQVRASWLLQEVLRVNPTLFSGDLPDRTHQFEAALFMMGASLETHEVAA